MITTILQKITLAVLFTLLSMPLLVCADTSGREPQILQVLASNTATQSGLLKTLARAFEADNPPVRINIKSGGALAIIERARNGEADLVITHHPPSELLFMVEGFGVSRTLLMYNQFALFGPPSYKTNTLSGHELLDVLRQLARDEVPFVVPAITSGTQMKLAELWSLAGIKPDWPGYEISGNNSAASLRQAALFGTYAFADMATYLANRDTLSEKLIPVYRDHSALRNYYSAIVVNGARFNRNLQQPVAEAFVNFLVSPQGQSIIKTHGEDVYHYPLFTPAAHLDEGLKSRQARMQLMEKQQNLWMMTSLAVLLGVFCIVACWLFVRTRRIQHQVLHDALTGLPNRLLLNDRLEQTIKYSARVKGPFSLLMIDLNGFKSINDSHGHHIGDEVLVCVGQRLRQLLRVSDTVARLGGDEFAVLLVNADVTYANQVAQKILFTLKQAITINSNKLYVGASLGICTYPQHGADMQSLVRHADAAMYVAKRGNSGVSTYKITEIMSRHPAVDNQV